MEINAQTNPVSQTKTKIIKQDVEETMYGIEFQANYVWKREGKGGCLYWRNRGKYAYQDEITLN